MQTKDYTATSNESSDFPKVFENVMKNTGTTIYALAEKSKIDYSTISKVKKGTRNISADYFRKLVNNWPGITPIDKDRLSDSFVFSNMGEGRFGEFIELLRFRRESELADSPDAFKVNIDFRHSVIALTTENTAKATVKNVIDNEFEQKSGDGRIYTNLPLDLIIPLLSSHKKTSPGVKPIDYKHIMEIETGTKPTPSTIANAMKLTTYGYPVSYISTPLKLCRQVNALFPYYLISTDCVVNISADIAFGYVEKNKSVADIYAVRFQRMFEQATPYVDTTGDILQLKGLYLSNNKGIFDKHYDYGAFCSYVFHIDEDIMSRIAKPDVPNRDYLIQSTTAYYRTYYDLISEQISFVPKKELSHFVDTGHVNMLPDEYSFNINVDDRVRLLQSTLEAIENGKEKIFILKDNVCLDSENNIVEMFYSHKPGNTSLSFLSRIEAAPMHFIGNSSMFIRNTETIEEFNRFFEYLQLSSCCYSEEESLMIFKDELTRCMLLPHNKN